MRLLAAVGLALAMCAAGCGAGARGGAGWRRDAPYDLAEDGDLAARRAQLDAIPPGAAARVAARGVLQREYARRLRAELAAGELAPARVHLLALLSMWSARELAGEAARRELGAERQLIGQARTRFARAGDDVGAAAALAVLAWLEPGEPSHAAELDEIFAYGDALALARNGAGAERSRPIEILAELALHFPARPVVDRLIALLVERRRAVEHQVRAAAASAGLIRAHDGVGRTTWSIVGALARADRLAEAPAAVAGVTGFGDDRELKARLAAALAPGARAAELARLATYFRATPARPGDDRAVLAIARRGLERAPDDALLHTLAGDAARDLEMPLCAIHHYEAALGRGGDRTAPGAATALASLYEQQIAELTQADRAGAGREMLARFEALAARTPAPLTPDLADAHAALGRGLVSLGELAEGRAHLERALATRPTLPALEMLGTIALRQGRAGEAIDLYRRAMKLSDGGPDGRYNRAKLFRLLADALTRAGRAAEAGQVLAAGLDEWSAIGDELELPAPYVAESLAERGKIFWQLGHKVTARRAFQAALDADPSASTTHADVVAFLVVRDAPEATLEAYLAGLGSKQVAGFFKVYMSLWIVAEALRRGEPPPALAREYLAARTGDLWPDQLARLATGRADFADLEPRATTRGRRAELYYYAAVLGEARRDPRRARALLERVRATDMVLFFEYEMAERWLGKGAAK